MDTIDELKGESTTRYLLRVAAAFIAAHPYQAIAWYGDTGTGSELAEDLLKEREELIKQEFEATGTQLTGNLIEAGNDPQGVPRIIIQTSASQLRDCGPLPFYLASTITIKPIPR